MSINAAKNAVNRAIGVMTTCTIRRSGTKRGDIADTTSGNVFVYRNGYCVAKPYASANFIIVFESGDGSWNGQLSDDYTAEDFTVAQSKVYSDLLHYITSVGPRDIEVNFEG